MDVYYIRKQSLTISKATVINLLKNDISLPIRKAYGFGEAFKSIKGMLLFSIWSIQHLRKVDHLQWWRVLPFMVRCMRMLHEFSPYSVQRISDVTYYAFHSRLVVETRTGSNFIRDIFFSSISAWQYELNQLNQDSSLLPGPGRLLYLIFLHFWSHWGDSSESVEAKLLIMAIYSEYLAEFWDINFVLPEINTRANSLSVPIGNDRLELVKPSGNDELVFLDLKRANLTLRSSRNRLIMEVLG